MVAFLLSPLGRLLGACAISGLLAGSASMWVTRDHYKTKIAEIQLEQAKKESADATEALQQFQGATEKIATAANNYSKLQDAMTKDFDGILRNFKNATFKSPLPVDCKPTVERMRAIQAAVAAANAQSYATARQ